MRGPFAYENNAFIIRQLLVPDPFAETTWRHILTSWEASEREQSLLEWIIRKGHIPEAALTALMCEAGGVELAGDGPIPPAEENADRKLLEGNGYIVLGNRSGKGLVTGGPDFPPALGTILGDRENRWQWVLISPLHDIPEPLSDQAAGVTGQSTPQTELENWITDLLEEARLTGASDIHFELSGEQLHVRTRTNGRMRKLATAGKPRSTECVRFLKRLANLSTADNPLPQDGRICMGSGYRQGVYRASHIRTTQGDSLVLRTVNRPTAIPGLGELSVPEELQSLLRVAATTDTGLILCTGATCSGKSTTLFSLLKEIGEMPLKIISIEDPVEVEIENLTQSSVDEDRGWTFPEALRAYLRQDPDVLFVGEIRDRESAEGAARAALTGHAVLSTLHAASPVAALDRLRGWGLQPGLIAETIRLVTHQRLVRSSTLPELTAEFTWIKPDPQILFDYLSGGPVPVDWE